MLRPGLLACSIAFTLGAGAFSPVAAGSVPGFRPVTVGPPVAAPGRAARPFEVARPHRGRPDLARHSQRGARFVQAPAVFWPGGGEAGQVVVVRGEPQFPSAITITHQPPAVAGIRTQPPAQPVIYVLNPDREWERRSALVQSRVAEARGRGGVPQEDMVVPRVIAVRTR